MVPVYSLSYSKAVIERFSKERGRGVLLMETIWPFLSKKRVVQLFSTEQNRWNIYKKLTKQADRLLRAGYDPDVVVANTLTSVKYFREIAVKELEIAKSNAIYLLTS